MTTDDTIAVLAFYLFTSFVLYAASWLYDQQPSSSLSCLSYLRSSRFLRWLCAEDSVSELDPPRCGSSPSTTSMPASIRDYLYCFLGLQVTLIGWGYLQERIMTVDYNEKGERFLYSEALVCCNRVFAVILAFSMQLYLTTNINTDQTRRPPPYKYAFASLSNVLSSWFQYEALKFVSFPLQVLAKSSKMLFAMLMTRVVMGRKHSYGEYLLCSLIAAGLVIYRFSEVAARQATNSNGSPSELSAFVWGVVLLVGYLVADSFTSTWQEKIFKTYHVSQITMMLGINCWSVFLSLSSLTLQGHLRSVYVFARSHPLFLQHVLLMSLFAAFSQLFIFHTISKIGALSFVAMMTARQLFSILYSIYSFGHTVDSSGAFGLLLVFSALTIKITRDAMAGSKRNMEEKESASIDLEAQRSPMS